MGVEIEIGLSYLVQDREAMILTRYFEQPIKELFPLAIMLVRFAVRKISTPRGSRKGAFTSPA